MERARPALGLWIKVVVVWQLVVLVGSALYVAVNASAHTHGFAWIGPAVGAVFGTALPLQITVVAVMRSARG